MRAVRATLNLSEDARDNFLLSRPGVRGQGDPPPAPEYWMHQLGSEADPRLNGPYLDPETFLARTRAVLGATQ
jgi:hypothetical protein